MRFHHIAIFVTDMEASLRLYRDFLGFKLLVDRELPDGPGEGSYFDQGTLDDIFGMQGSRTRMAILATREGAMIELQQPSTPAIERTPDEYRRYGRTGINEMALTVTDIDDWFERTRAAGYETQTEYVWEYANLGRSFLFYDPDGNMVQLCEDF